MSDRRCLMCGKPLTGNRTKFCSDECKKQAYKYGRPKECDNNNPFRNVIPECQDCIYHKQTWAMEYCGFLGIIGKRRPCKPGKDCTVKVKRRPGKPKTAKPKPFKVKVKNKPPEVISLTATC